MKKYTFLVLAVFMTLSLFLAGCGNKEPNKAPENNEGQQESTTTKEEQTATTGKYYFTANEGGSISKIDAATNEVVETIMLEGAVHNVQVSPDGKVLGATLVPGMGHDEEMTDDHNSMTDNHGNDQNMNMDEHSNANASEGHSMDMRGFALFFDTQTNELIKKIQVGNHPAHIVVNTHFISSQNPVIFSNSFGIMTIHPPS